MEPDGQCSTIACWPVSRKNEPLARNDVGVVRTNGPHGRRTRPRFALSCELEGSLPGPNAIFCGPLPTAFQGKECYYGKVGTGKQGQRPAGPVACKFMKRRHRKMQFFLKPFRTTFTLPLACMLLK